MALRLSTKDKRFAARFVEFLSSRVKAIARRAFCANSIVPRMRCSSHRSRKSRSMSISRR